MKKQKAVKRKWNRKMYQYENGIPLPRVYFRKAHHKMSPRYLVKCGNCNGAVEIYCGDNLEIGGVLASIKEWRKILFPLLKEKNESKNKKDKEALLYNLR